MSAHFKNVGDIIMILGETKGHIGGSEYLKVCHGMVAGDAPDLDLVNEKNIQSACLEMIHHGLINSAHDTSDGGLAVALAECCFFHREDGLQLGARISYKSDVRSDFMLFGEDQSRIIVSVSKKNIIPIMDIARNYKISIQTLGEVIPDVLEINGLINLKVEVMSEGYYGAIEKLMRA
jgi:phosphoribosylformylglycinamidine synthase